MGQGDMSPPNIYEGGTSTDDLIDELPVEKRHLSKLIIICWI